MPPLLVLDCATEQVHLGLDVAGQQWQRVLPGGAQASAVLLPAVMAMLAEADVELRALGAIGFGRGPGAFTGVRTACAVAQGLAFGASLPVLALDTLMAVAEDARAQGAPDTLWVAVDARMGEAYAAHYQWGDSGWQVLAAPALHDPVGLATHAQGAAVAGNSLTAHGLAWANHDGGAWPEAGPRAGALLALARAAWQRGERLDAADALPLYVRDKVAQTTAERAAARAAAAA